MTLEALKRIQREIEALHRDYVWLRFRFTGVEERDITDVDQEELEEEQDPPLLEES